jgi:hypothetical protein
MPGKVVAGKVVAGKVIVEGTPLAEGEDVHVLVADEDDDAQFSLTAEEEAELEERIAAVNRGDHVEYESVDAFMRALRTKRDDRAPHAAHSSEG